MTSIGGDRGHGLVEDASNRPVKIGGRAHSTPPAQQSDGDRVNAYFDTRGRLVVILDSEESITTTFVNATASGNTQVVAAVAGSKIRVIRVRAINKDSSTINVNFQSATTEITATDMLALNGGGYVDNPSQGWVMETVAGEALNINLSAIGIVGCSVTYKLV